MCLFKNSFASITIILFVIAFNDVLAEDKASAQLDLARQHYLNARDIFYTNRSDVVEPEKIEAAISELTRAVQLNPSMTEAHVLLSDVYWEKSSQFNWDSPDVKIWRQKANDSIEQALLLSPDDPTIHYARLRDLKGAKYIEAVQDIVDKFPDYAPARRSLAKALARRNKPEQAISEYYRYFELLSDEGAVVGQNDYASLWGLLTVQNRKDEAIELLNRFMESEHPRTVAQTLNSFFDFSGYSESRYRETINKANKYKNFDNDQYYREARNALSENRLAEAMEAFDRHLEANPYNVRYFIEFAKALLSSGNYKEAYSVYEKQLDSEHLADSDKCVELNNVRLRIEYIEPDRSLPRKIVNQCGYKVILVQ